MKPKNRETYVLLAKTAKSSFQGNTVVVVGYCKSGLEMGRECWVVECQYGYEKEIERAQNSVP
jgi:hypothetical protein